MRFERTFKFFGQPRALRSVVRLARDPKGEEIGFKAQNGNRSHQLNTVPARLIDFQKISTLVQAFGLEPFDPGSDSPEVILEKIGIFRPVAKIGPTHTQ